MKATTPGRRAKRGSGGSRQATYFPAGPSPTTLPHFNSAPASQLSYRRIYTTYRQLWGNSYFNVKLTKWEEKRVANGEDDRSRTTADNHSFRRNGITISGDVTRLPHEWLMPAPEKRWKNTTRMKLIPLKIIFQAADSSSGYTVIVTHGSHKTRRFGQYQPAY